MEPIIVGVFQKNRTKVVAGQIAEFEDKIYAHIRAFSLGIDGGLVATRQGVAMPLTCVPAVRDAVHRLSDVAGPNRVVGKIEMGRDQIWVGTRLYEENMYLDIRRFYEKDGEWHYTAKGVMVAPEKLDALISLVDELAEEAAKLV